MNNEMIITADRALDLARQLSNATGSNLAGIEAAIMAFEEVDWFGLARDEENLWDCIRGMEWCIRRECPITWWVNDFGKWVKAGLAGTDLEATAAEAEEVYRMAYWKHFKLRIRLATTANDRLYLMMRRFFLRRYS
jgi:hypothetical protein